MLRGIAMGLAALLLAGCSASGTAEVEEEVAVSINDTCPMMGSPVEDDGGRTEYAGETVGFCCPGCIDEFEALDDAGKVAALAEVGVTLDS